eukprot:14470165-Alexandrium_andersonii.AAC.1
MEGLLHPRTRLDHDWHVHLGHELRHALEQLNWKAILPKGLPRFRPAEQRDQLASIHDRHRIKVHRGKGSPGLGLEILGL